MKKRVRKNLVISIILIVIVLAVAYFAYSYYNNGVLFSPTRAIGITRISVTAQPIYSGPQNAVRALCPAPRLVMKNDSGAQIFSFDYTKLGMVETIIQDGRSDHLSFSRSMNSTNNLNFYFSNDCCFQGNCSVNLGTDIRIYNITVNGKSYAVNKILVNDTDSVAVPLNKEDSFFNVGGGSLSLMPYQGDIEKVSVFISGSFSGDYDVIVDGARNPIYVSISKDEMGLEVIFDKNNSVFRRIFPEAEYSIGVNLSEADGDIKIYDSSGTVVSSGNYEPRNHSISIIPRMNSITGNEVYTGGGVVDTGLNLVGFIVNQAVCDDLIANGRHEETSGTNCETGKPYATHNRTRTYARVSMIGQSITPNLLKACYLVSDQTTDKNIRCGTLNGVKFVNFEETKGYTVNPRIEINAIRSSTNTFTEQMLFFRIAPPEKIKSKSVNERAVCTGSCSDPYVSEVDCLKLPARIEDRLPTKFDRIYTVKDESTTFSYYPVFAFPRWWGLTRSDSFLRYDSIETISKKSNSVGGPFCTVLEDKSHENGVESEKKSTITNSYFAECANGKTSKTVKVDEFMSPRTPTVTTTTQGTISSTRGIEGSKYKHCEIDYVTTIG